MLAYDVDPSTPGVLCNREVSVGLTKELQWCGALFVRNVSVPGEIVNNCDPYPSLAELNYVVLLMLRGIPQHKKEIDKGAPVIMPSYHNDAL